jgi:hypothetical protein
MGFNSAFKGLRFGSDTYLAVMMTRTKNLYKDNWVLESELNQGVPRYETGVTVTVRQESRRRTLLSERLVTY